MCWTKGAVDVEGAGLAFEAEVGRKLESFIRSKARPGERGRVAAAGVF